MAGEAILIVDDDPFMRDLLDESLTELEYRTIPAVTGKEALHALSVNEIHVALIDLSLGDMSGLEIVDSVIDGSPDTQIIIMTGYPSIQSAIDALRRGAQDYIIKPFKMPEIHAAVTRSLKNQRLEAEVRVLRRKVRDQEHELLQLKTRAGTTGAGPRPQGVVRPPARPAGLPGGYGGAHPVLPPPEAPVPGPAPAVEPVPPADSTADAEPAQDPPPAAEDV
jgi:ActR/RegA family two-component response regulator